VQRRLKPLKIRVTKAKFEQEHQERLLRADQAEKTGRNPGPACRANCRGSNARFDIRFRIGALGQIADIRDTLIRDGRASSMLEFQGAWNVYLIQSTV
jgi:hypothetical protein